MTYPYFYENKPNYGVDKVTKLPIKTEAKYSILNDGLKQAILSRTNFEITTLSTRSNREWRESYLNFIKNLRSYSNELSTNNINFKPYFIANKAKAKLHAKIMLAAKKENNTYCPVALMIGSSNLTNMAFGVEKNFNYEADILLWGNGYTFNYEELSKGEFPPIICNAINEEVETFYIKKYWEDYIKTFKEVIDKQ